MDYIWTSSFNAVMQGVAGMFNQFLRFENAFNMAFDLVFALVMVYFVVKRLLPLSFGSGSDKVRKPRKKDG